MTLFNNFSLEAVFNHFVEYHGACMRFALNVNNADYVDLHSGESA